MSVFNYLSRFQSNIRRHFNAVRGGKIFWQDGKQLAGKSHFLMAREVDWHQYERWMIKGPSLSLRVLHILVLQDRPDREYICPNNVLKYVLTKKVIIIQAEKSLNLHIFRQRTHCFLHYVESCLQKVLRNCKMLMYNDD